MIQEQILSLQQELDARRFRGEDPIIPIPVEDLRESIIAKVLAAQSRHALLELDSEPFNPDEDSAERRLAAGQTRLDYWNFRDARRLFDEAGKRARRPDLQQRITLFRLLTDFLREIVTTDFDRTLTVRVHNTVLEPIQRFDALPTEEAAHYRAEIERLWAMRGALKDDPFLQTVWLTVQARIAMDFSESAQGITWLLAAANLNRERLEPNAYLQGMLDRARNRILKLIGQPTAADPAGEASIEASPDDAETKASGKEARKEADDRVRPRDLYDTLLLALEDGWGTDVRAAGAMFRVKRYFAGGRDNDDADLV